MLVDLRAVDQRAHVPLPPEFVCTVSDGHVTDSSPLFGLDCEMCLTCVGLEVTRVALVDSSGCCVLDELVKPPNPIIDYCTRFSGITRAILAPVSTRLADVQSRLLQLLPPDAVLVGHSLDGDLRALYLVHPHVIDTSLLYRQEFGRRFKLKHLAQVVLKREIQSEVRIGHDPGEDALAALHLAQYFIRKGPRERLRQMCVLYVGPLPSDATETLVHRLLKHCGRLRTIRLLHYTHEVHSEVVFEHLEGAQLALEHLNGLQINDCIIKVSHTHADTHTHTHTLSHTHTHTRHYVYISSV
uniref:RRM domain-containing protein n=1 Tax=Sinocyclocheilus anshuiensis TaxID=1608454 RepID=A0A671SWC5_9TELE